MAGIKLKDAVKGKKTVAFDKKPALYASVCDCCGKIFKMKPVCGDANLGMLEGIFDRCAVDEGGRGLGNQFRAMVCSFKCADGIMVGGWKKMEQYNPYAKAKADLVRCELRITSHVVGKDELIEEWKKKPAQKYGVCYIQSGSIFTSTTIK